MKLVFIYGPPAAGKLTVATEISRLIDYKLLDNHAVINAVTRIFPFSDTEHADVRRKLARDIRLEMYRVAAENDINLITTLGAAGPQYFDFYEAIQNVVEDNGGKVLFVQLLPTMDTLLDRVENQSRVDLHKIDSKEVLSKRLSEQPENFDKYPNMEHKTIDNTNMSPEEVAKTIIDHYNL